MYIWLGSIWGWNAVMFEDPIGVCKQSPLRMMMSHQMKSYQMLEVSVGAFSA